MGPGWPELSVHLLRNSWKKEQKYGRSFVDFLFLAAQRDILFIRALLNNYEHRDSVRWSALPIDSEQAPAETDLDNLIFCWLAVKRVDDEITQRNSPKYAEVLHTLLPPRSETLEKLLEVAAVEFRRQGKVRPDGRRPTDAVFRQILQYYKSYNPNTHLAPYTSIIGLSGIGKSFAVAEMARHYGVYVVYLSLARSNSAAYPPRSSIAGGLPHNERRAHQVRCWQSFLVLGLHAVQTCREFSISPAFFYDMLVNVDFHSFQVAFAEHVKALAEAFVKDTSQNTWQALHDLAKKRVPKLRRLVKSWVDKSKEQSKDDPVAPLSAECLSALFCVDEARALLDGDEKRLFRSFREALERCWYYRSSKGLKVGNSQRGESFAILLDTLSKVANFSPPLSVDPSQKARMKTGSEIRTLFSPIWMIDTMDLEDLGDRHRDGSNEAILELFRLGRPLWNDWVKKFGRPSKLATSPAKSWAQVVWTT